jgi:Family of unknown function (DUF6084)
VSALADSRAIPRLAFAVEDAAVQELAAVPALRLAVRIERVGGGPVRSIALQAQVRIAAPRRGYDRATQERLVEVFGPPGDWGRTLQSVLWTHASVMVGPFEDATVAALVLPCTYDFDVAAAKYLDALRDGHVPLELMFSGTVFSAGADGRLAMTHIASDCEASFALPVRLWREAMARSFGDTAWVRLDRDTFDRLYAYRASRVLGTWEATLDALLKEAGA